MVTTKSSPQRKAMSIAMLTAISAMAAAPVFANAAPCDVTASGSNLTLGSGDCTVEAAATVSGATANAAITVNGAAGTLTNLGSLVGGPNGLLLSAGSLDSLANSGLIQGDVNGVSVDASSSISTLTNLGSITSGAGGGGAGVSNAGTIASLTNSGQITGIANNGQIGSVNNSAGIIAAVEGVANLTGTIGTLSNSGTISSTGTMFAPGSAVYNNSLISEVENTGSVVGGEYGEGLENGPLGTVGTLLNDTGGTISGGLYAVQNLHQIGSLTNNGLISANAGAGVAAVQNGLGATITSLENAGTILGTGTLYPTAVGNNGYIGTLDNSGALLTAGALDSTTYGLSNNSTIGTLTNSGTIAGSAAGAGVDNAPGSTIGTFSNTGKVLGLLNYGTISSLDNQAIGTFSTATIAKSAVLNAGTISSLSNEGLIGNLDGSSTAGVSNSGRVIALDNAGSIVGYNAVSNTGTIGSLRNELNGTLGGGATAVSNAAMSNIGTLTNLGHLTTSGVGAAGIFNSGTIGTLSNAGTIQALSAGPSATGVANHGSITTFNNSGVIGANGSGAGLENDGTIQAADNQGQLEAVQNILGAATHTYIGQFTNEASGVILGTGVTNGAAVLNGNATIASLTNAGQIGSVGGTSSPTGVNNGGLITTIVNTGVIGGATYGLQNAGTIGSISNAGQIVTGTAGVGQMALENTGNVNTVDNSGTINGQTGVENFGTITSLTNDAGGAISGNAAVLNIGYVASISNAGNIAGVFQGIENLGRIGSIDNSGTISSIVNSGTIGTGATAIVNEVNGNLAMLTNTGVISGDIENLSSSTLTITGGLSPNSVGTFTGASGAIGQLTSQNANLVLASGNVLLNDNVDLGGTHTLSNTAGTLQINSQLTLNGNYQQSAGASLLLGVADGAVAGGTMAGDSGYGRLVVSGNATIDAGSSVGLQKLATYAFAPGQRFVVVDAGGANTNFNAGALRFSATGFNGSIAGQDVVNNGRHDLVLTLSAAGTGTGGTGTGSGTGGSGSGNTGTSTGGSGTGTDSGTGTGTGGGSTGTTSGDGPGDGSTGAGVTVPTLPTAPTNPQARSSFSGLMRYTGSSNAPLLNLFNAVDALAYTGSAGQVNRAGQQLSPLSQAASASHAAAAPTLDVLNIVGGRTSSLRLADGGTASGVATGDGTPRVGVWGQAFGGHASQDAEDQVDGYSANYAGVLVGADVAVAPNWIAGGVFAYSNTAVNNTGATAGDSTRVNGYGLTGYASYSGNPWYVNLAAGITPQHFNTTRAVSFDGFSGVADGSFSGQQYVARAEFGFPLQLAYATLTPVASLTYSYSHQSAYTETGGNGTALSVDATHDTSVRSSLGAKIERGFTTAYGQLVPELSAYWVHEFDHSRLVTGASYAADLTGQTAFTTVGASPVADFADLGLGATLLRASNLSLTARYELQAGKGFVSQTGSLRLRQLF